jgi:hypothetical protein
MSLDEIHLSGEVPQCTLETLLIHDLPLTRIRIAVQSALQPSMTKFFRRLKVDSPVTRSNYGFQVIDPNRDELDPEELAWCTTTSGPEDAEKNTPALQPPPTITPSTILYRNERQTIRRLPRTGAVVFTIRTYLAPLEILAREPGVPRHLAEAVRGWNHDVWRCAITRSS